MKNLIKLFSLLVIITLTFSCGDDEISTTCEDNIENLKSNEIQVLGSHNSYRMSPPEEILAFVSSAVDMLPDGFDPGTWDYNNSTIDAQLDIFGIRSIELDVYRDPTGGMFYNRMGNAFVGQSVESGIARLQEPGLKVLHFPDFDYNSHFLTFKDALQYLKTWSAQNPNHLPFSVLVEAKEDSPDVMLPGMGLTATLPFINNSVEEIENEIIDVFGQGSDNIFKPDDLRKNHPSLRSAALNKEWPTLEDARGKITFILMARQGVIDEYVGTNPQMENRMMFVFTDPEKDQAAFLAINDPVNNFQEINNYVLDGFVVRTQADSNTYEARDRNYDRMKKAFNSGAQIICTDYYMVDQRFASDSEWSDYHVSFPDNQLALINHNADQTGLDGCEILE
ncbi:MAG: phosphatidylinositol-specific phospholipase C1-like protein [Bacteroidia bacterium]|nr:phosphatidylinositol-specific phospholipase C1-like protein [Bacteroidia bacterium]